MVDKIIVRGERCSGTNYLYSLIKTNFNVPICSELGWKHSYINTFNKNLVNHNTYLVIFIFRNPVDWVRSFYENPWHFEKKYATPKFKDITEFIQTKPKQIVKGLNEFKEFDRFTELYWERHPFTLKSPENICQIRNWKNENFLNASNILSNVEYIQYEKLIENPKIWLDWINEKYFNLDYIFMDVDYYKGDEKQGLYQKKVYEKLSKDNLDFLRDNLNWSIEEKIGYFKKNLEEYNK